MDGSKAISLASMFWFMACCYAVATVHWAVSSMLLCGYWHTLCWVIVWYVVCGCWYVARVLWMVARELLCSCLNVVDGCQGVAFQLLGWSEWLLACCSAIAWPFWVIWWVKVRFFPKQASLIRYILPIYEMKFIITIMSRGSAVFVSFPHCHFLSFVFPQVMSQ